MRPSDSRRRRALRTLAVLVLLAALITEGAPSWWKSYRIQRGDTLSAIADRYNTTVARLVRANNLPGSGSIIYAGEVIKVPGKRTPRSRYKVIRHRVRSGETLSHVAARYGVTVRAIARGNGLRNANLVRAGQVLRVRVKASRSSRRPAATRNNTFLGRTYPNAVVNAAAVNRRRLQHMHVPSRSQVRRMIVRTARQHGVDPYLALAVAYQESGWNQRAVSVANAIGVMQVIPSTGRWISSVYGRRLNLLNARDNIIAGVVYLKVLRAQAPLRIAVAGYYQGLAGVRRNGMYPDTKRYVANILSLRRQLR